MSAMVNEPAAGADRVRAEIDLAAVAHNVRLLRRITHPRARLLVAVKADGYGHGAVAVARTALAHGATDLGVAHLAEGLVLRRQGISAPILIFGHTPPQWADQMFTNNLTPTVFSTAAARVLSAAARRTGRRLPVHVKIDTGMGRLGFMCDALRPTGSPSAVAELLETARLPGIDLQGIFTHFATADQSDLRSAQRQLDRFLDLLDQLERAGLSVALKHAANSGAILQMPAAHLDMVRAGIAVYGLPPSREVVSPEIDLQPVMSLKAPVIHLKTVPAGTSISYGGTYTTPRATRIATIPVGYADGYRRSLSNRGHMLVRGYRAPIVGRVCMDLTMIDVGEIPEVAVGDEVVIMGRQRDQAIDAGDLADLLDTIHYEVVSAITARVPRCYATAVPPD
ncbi:alanine racemase [Desulfatitalea alkaliphila]|uniref:Alanine racemase n=1 Tax=Desulfatitalea alkaliphila TaxID=2929485 RepID=A0AA41R3Z9_9BACT|nr:alanine racemase [Desulfatitalea alkaliphila]MCJ8500480.1 alanine racemase [Desulfatitalea alkaliphila]